MTVKAFLLVSSLVSVCLVPLAGCSASADAPIQQVAPNTADLEIKRIQDEKFMPPEAKAAAIARIKSRPVPDKPKG